MSSTPVLETDDVQPLSPSSPTKKRQLAEVNVGVEGDLEARPSKKECKSLDIISIDSDDDEPETNNTTASTIAWKMPKGGKLCTVNDMPQPQEGYVLVTWIEQSCNSAYSYSHTNYMIPTADIDATQWQSLVSSNNVISEPADRFEYFTEEEGNLLCELIDEQIPKFLQDMKQYCLPDGAIPDISLVRAFIITGIINE